VVILRQAMSRKLRNLYSGAIYHVMNRGDHAVRIFRDFGRSAAAKTERLIAEAALAEGLTDQQDPVLEKRAPGKGEPRTQAPI
jgi:hypothetical protein